MRTVYLVLLILLIFYLCNDSAEHFVSGNEKLSVRYDQILPLDHPKYITPQQKDFQIVLSEHSALDPNMQNRRLDIRTQKCKPGERCFNTQEYHELNYKMQSAPDIISSKIDMEPKQKPCTRYLRHGQNLVVPANSTAREMRADLFDDIVLPELFFERRMECETQTQSS